MRLCKIYDNKIQHNASWKYFYNDPRQITPVNINISIYSIRLNYRSGCRIYGKRIYTVHNLICAKYVSIFEEFGLVKCFGVLSATS